MLALAILGVATPSVGLPPEVHLGQVARQTAAERRARLEDIRVRETVGTDPTTILILVWLLARWWVATLPCCFVFALPIIVVASILSSSGCAPGRSVVAAPVRLAGGPRAFFRRLLG